MKVRIQNGSKHNVNPPTPTPQSTYKLLTETKLGGVAGISAGTGTLAVSVT